MAHPTRPAGGRDPSPGGPVPAPAPVAYVPRLGLFSGTMAVIGGIIGSGIFFNPAIVAARVGTAPLTLAAWIMGGVVAILGAFVYGELAARVPRVGGGYAYLRDAFGPLPAFLYAWALLLIVATGAIAAVAFTFASYAGALFGLPERVLPFLAAGAILALSALNYIGVEPAAWTQNVFTLLKLAALAGLIAAGLLLPFAAAAPPPMAAPLRPPSGIGGVRPGAPPPPRPVLSPPPARPPRTRCPPRSAPRRDSAASRWRSPPRSCRCSSPTAGGRRPTLYPGGGGGPGRVPPRG